MPCASLSVGREKIDLNCWVFTPVADIFLEPGNLKHTKSASQPIRKIKNKDDAIPINQLGSGLGNECRQHWVVRHETALFSPLYHCLKWVNELSWLRSKSKRARWWTDWGKNDDVRRGIFSDRTTLNGGFSRPSRSLLKRRVDSVLLLLFFPYFSFGRRRRRKKDSKLPLGGYTQEWWKGNNNESRSGWGEGGGSDWWGCIIYNARSSFQVKVKKKITSRPRLSRSKPNSFSVYSSPQIPVRQWWWQDMARYHPSYIPR